MEKNGKSVNVIEAIEAELSDWSEEEAPQQAVMLGPNDVLFGRGTGISGYAGNKNFRKIVWEYRVRNVLSLFMCVVAWLGGENEEGHRQREIASFRKEDCPFVRRGLAFDHKWFTNTLLYVYF